MFSIFSVHNCSKYAFEVWDWALVGMKGLLTTSETKKNFIFQCYFFQV